MTQILFIDFSWKKEDLITCLPILICLVFFVMYWFTAQSSKIKTIFYAKYSSDEASVKHIFFTKYMGLILMGIIPAVICLILIPNTSLAYYGLTIIPETTLFSIIWTLGLSALVIPIAYFSAKKRSKSC
ncbi:MAG: hypothetical protein IPJ60_08190 [Sphingobacteriaceae bacterium]|nr:hypothetical protein [Sphingobacteriaceae bacterium]